MAYYIVTVKECKQGARRRRKLVVASSTKPAAMITIQDMCRGTGFIPDYTTIGEITPHRYLKVIGTLLGRTINRNVA
jgi:hypothetical protein